MNTMIRVCNRLLLTLLLLLAPAVLTAQVVDGRLTTSAYTWEKFDTVGISKVLLRGYQTLQLSISQGDVSVQTNVLGSMSMKSGFGDEATARVRNLFLRWKNIAGAAEMSLGRVPIFSGVGIGTVDGGMLRARAYGDRLTLVAYGGANVRSDLISYGLDDLKNNLLIGGQAIVVPAPDARFGVSYMNRRVAQEQYTAFRPDSLFNPIPFLVTPDSRAEQLLGVDGRYSRDGLFSLWARYDHDLNLKRPVRAEATARVEVTRHFALTADMLYREPRVDYNSFFTMFPTSPVREYEGGVEYAFRSSLRAFGRFAYVSYSGDVSRRLIGGLASTYASIRYSGSNGYAGELSSLYGEMMYPLFNRLFVPTAGISYASYRQSADTTDRQTLFAGSFGFVLRPTQTFSFDAQVQWLRNPVAENDVRFFGRVNYWFHETLKFFQQKGSDQ